jgi:hypothetical protein
MAGRLLHPVNFRGNDWVVEILYLRKLLASNLSVVTHFRHSEDMTAISDCGNVTAQAAVLRPLSIRNST